ncbi:MAG: hypothetical protein FWB96_11600 [Defluviitaleaceae bacterium]|nr:hypothetical protein [Defluviitaleaceae bacterium]MCL2263727.1 hypothetical protein [Defluviitaleaceae bacterium]
MFCPKCGDEYGDTPALLCTVYSHIEADRIEALLKCENIPVLKKPRNGGDITMLYMGVSYADTDIYVPSKLLNCAEILLTPAPEDLTDLTEPDPEFEAHKEVYAEEQFSKIKKIGWFFFIVMGIPLIAVIFTILRHILNI